MNAVIIKEDIRFMDMVRTIKDEISQFEIPSNSIDFTLEEALERINRGESAYVYISECEDPTTFEPYLDVNLGCLDVTRCAWEIRCRRDEELYTIIKFTESTDQQMEIQKLHKSNDAKDVLINHLENKVTELQNIIVQMMNKAQGSEQTGVKVKEDTFVELVNRFNSEFVGRQDDETFFNAEYEISYQGLTTSMGQCPALFDMFKRYEQEYL